MVCVALLLGGCGFTPIYIYGSWVIFVSGFGVPMIDGLLHILQMSCLDVYTVSREEHTG